MSNELLSLEDEEDRDIYIFNKFRLHLAGCIFPIIIFLLGSLLIGTIIYIIWKIFK